jgi:hypothetical protein
LYIDGRTVSRAATISAADIVARQQNSEAFAAAALALRGNQKVTATAKVLRRVREEQEAFAI